MANSNQIISAQGFSLVISDAYLDKSSSEVPYMKLSLIFGTLLLLLTIKVFGQDPHGNFAAPAQDLKPEYQRKGELFSIRIIPAGKETKLFIVGNETASIKVDKLHVTGKIRVGQNERIIVFNRKNDYFSAPGNLKGDLDLKLEQKDTKKTENFKIELNNP